MYPRSGSIYFENNSFFSNLVCWKDFKSKTIVIVKTESNIFKPEKRRQGKHNILEIFFHWYFSSSCSSRPSRLSICLKQYFVFNLAEWIVIRVASFPWRIYQTHLPPPVCRTDEPASVLLGISIMWKGILYRERGRVPLHSLMVLLNHVSSSIIYCKNLLLSLLSSLSFVSYKGQIFLCKSLVIKWALQWL